MLFCQLHKYGIHPVLIFLVVAHQFHIKILSKFLFPPEQSFFCLIFSHVKDLSGHFSIEVPCKDNDILLIFFDDLFINPGNVVKSFGVSNGRHFCQVMVTFLILRQQHDLVTVIFSGFVFMVFTHKEFTAYNGFKLPPFSFFSGFSGCSDLCLNTFIICPYFFHKMESSHHVRMICKCNRRHILFCRRIYKVFDTYGGLQYRKLAVVMKVGKSYFIKFFQVLLNFCGRNSGIFLLLKSLPYCSRSLLKVNVLKPDQLYRLRICF